MIRTILLDLDDTLLDNKMENFLPAYFQKLGHYMSDTFAPDGFIRELIVGSQKMLENTDPRVTLEKAFADYFYPALNLNASEVEAQIYTFYKQIFPSLEAVTATRPSARPVVESLLNQGFEIVVATNPLFPRVAIDERLRWANLAPEEISFTLVTSYEISHFTKPQSAYYAEILGQLGRRAHEVVMVGNDPVLDLDPALALSMRVYHLSDDPNDGYPGGNLVDMLGWIEQQVDAPDPEEIRTAPAVSARFRGHAGALATLVRELTKDEWERRPAAGEWAPVEIVCHLRDVEIEVNQSRLAAFSAAEPPHLSALDTDIWADERDYLCQSGPEALSDFLEARVALLQQLEVLTAEEWDQPALHSLLGPTSLLEVMGIATDHDLLHLAQMRSTLQEIN
ncbi:MAG: DinB family protein [Anaerolineales bacterium]|nr:DinB family protein [Anaerolineales bacterium]